jgi:hypothetical protein
MPSKKSGRAKKPRTQKESRTAEGLPASYAIGDSLDWKSGWNEVELLVELPFWLMVPDCRVTVAEAGHDFDVSIMSRAGRFTYVKYWIQSAIASSLETCRFRLGRRSQNSRKRHLSPTSRGSVRLF